MQKTATIVSHHIRDLVLKIGSSPNNFSTGKSLSPSRFTHNRDNNCRALLKQPENNTL